MSIKVYLVKDIDANNDDDDDDDDDDDNEYV
jgi:hypothetical protein